MRAPTDLRSQKMIKEGLEVFLWGPSLMIKLVTLNEKLGERLVVEEFLHTLQSVSDSAYILC